MKFNRALNQSVSFITACALSTSPIVLVTASFAASAEELKSCNSYHPGPDRLPHAKAQYLAKGTVPPPAKVKCLDGEGYEAEKIIHFEIKNNPSIKAMDVAMEVDVVRTEGSHWFRNTVYGVLGVGILATGAVIISKRATAKRIRLQRESDERMRQAEQRGREEGARIAQSAGITNTPRVVSAADLKIPNAPADQKISVVGAIPQSQIPPNAPQFTAGGNTYITQQNPNTGLLELMLIRDMQNAIFWDTFWVNRGWAPHYYSSPYVYGPGGIGSPVIVEPRYTAPIVYNDVVHTETPVEPSFVVNETEAAIDAGGTLESHEETFAGSSSESKVAEVESSRDSGTKQDDGFSSQSESFKTSERESFQTSERTSNSDSSDSFRSDPSPSSDSTPSSGSDGFSGGGDSGGGGGGGSDNAIGGLIGTGVIGASAAYGLSPRQAHAGQQR